MLQTFKRLAGITSLSYAERAAGDFVLDFLREAGIEAREDDAGAVIGGDCGNIIARLPATGAGAPILFSSHLDTVGPAQNIKPVEKDGFLISEGDTVLGADDKAGVAVILHALTVLKNGRKAHPEIIAVFTVAEEIGLAGARALDIKSIGAEAGFVFDDGGAVGKITVTAPFQDKFVCEFRGVAAHAGIEPEKGVNAVVAAAKAIGAMNLGRLSDSTTANIGMIKGGTVINIVPDKAVIEGEARSLSEVELTRQVEDMQNACDAAAAQTGATCDINITRLYDGFDLAPDNPVVQRANRGAAAAGFEPVLGKSGGGSDTNVFNARGIPSVNLGLGYENVHTVNERIAKASLDGALLMALAIAEETNI